MLDSERTVGLMMIWTGCVSFDGFCFGYVMKKKEGNEMREYIYSLPIASAEGKGSKVNFIILH